MKNKELGALGEKLARQHLKRAGYKIVTANYRSLQGEVDIIARHRGCLVFVEVKCRRGTAFGPPEEAVTTAKQKKLVQVGEYYIQHEAPDTREWRIDVVAVELDDRNRPLRIETIENAVIQQDY
jgi:putative endonuclease